MTSHPELAIKSSHIQLRDWLRMLADQGGKGVVHNLDARSLGRCADLLDSHSLAIAELEAKLAGVRQDTLQFVADRIRGFSEQDLDVSTCRIIEYDLIAQMAQPDRSKARQAVIEAAIVWADEPTPQHEADVLWAVQALTEPQP